MKYYGEIGFAITEDQGDGIWTEKITTRKYFGDITRMTRRYESSDKVNEDININNVISILSDPFANEHIGFIRYITWMNQKWKVTSVEVEYPRLILTIGGLYNGE